MRPNDVLDLRERLMAAWSDRDSAIAVNRDYVLGNQWTANQKIGLPEGVSPVTLNYCFPIALKNQTFLVGRPPELAVPLTEDTPAARRYGEWMEKFFYGVYEFNRMRRRYLDMAWNCTVAGGQPIIPDWDPVARMVRYKTPLPERYYPVGASDDDNMTCERFCLTEYYSPEFLASRYSDGDLSSWQTDYNDGGLEYVTVIRYSDANEHLWIRLGDGAVIDRRDGYGFVPGAYIPNIPVAGGLDGLADITLIRPLQDRLNQLLTSQADIIEMYADPPVILKGAGQDAASMQWGPGMKIPIERDGDVYFLQWEGTPPDFREHVTQIVSAIQDLSGIPDVAYGRYQASIQSGIALNTQFQPTRLLMAIKQGSWSDAFEEVNRQTVQLYRDRLGNEATDIFGMSPSGVDGHYPKPFSMSVRAQDLNGYVRSTLVWPGMLPKDDMSEMQMLLSRYQANALSLYTLLEECGIESPGDEISRIKSELADKELHPELQPEPVPGAEAPVGGTGSEAFTAGLGSLLDGGSTPGSFGLGADMSNVSEEGAYAERGAPMDEFV